MAPCASDGPWEGIRFAARPLRFVRFCIFHVAFTPEGNERCGQELYTQAHSWMWMDMSNVSASTAAGIEMPRFRRSTLSQKKGRKKNRRNETKKPAKRIGSILVGIVSRLVKPVAPRGAGPSGRGLPAGGRAFFSPVHLEKTRSKRIKGGIKVAMSTWVKPRGAAGIPRQPKVHGKLVARGDLSAACSAAHRDTIAR